MYKQKQSRQKNRQIERQIEGKNSETNGQKDKQTEGQTQRQTDTQTSTQKNKLVIQNYIYVRFSSKQNGKFCKKINFENNFSFSVICILSS